MRQALSGDWMRLGTAFMLCWAVHVVILSIVFAPTQAVRAQAASLQADAVADAPDDTPPGAHPASIDEPQIIGGQEAQPGAWPWQAALVSASVPDALRGQFCGGTLIRPRWVMTAAHCVVSNEPDQVEVVLGRHRLSDEEGERLAIAEIFVHPDFNYGTSSSVTDLGDDIALLHLAASSSQQPVTLYDGPAGQEESEYLAGTVTGWGYIDNFLLSDALHEVVVPLTAPDVCAQSYGSLLQENMICAGYAKGYKGPCYGDSGGPLLVRRSQETAWQQIGIVSWGSGCAEPGFYGVYTRVSSYTKWVDTCLADSTSRACTGLDAYEPDDGMQQATQIELGGDAQEHNFHLSADRDWLAFTAQAGRIYQIEARALGEGSDPLIWLYDSDGITPLAYDDDSGGDTSARLIWRATHSGSFYVELQDLAGGRGSVTAYSVQIELATIKVYLPVAAH